MGRRGHIRIESAGRPASTRVFAVDDEGGRIEIPYVVSVTWSAETGRAYADATVVFANVDLAVDVPLEVAELVRAPLVAVATVVSPLARIRRWIRG